MSESRAHQWFEHIQEKLHRLPPPVRKVFIGVAGGLLLAAGIVMLVTPGPAIVFIPAGLFLLASEFEWAHRWASRLQEKFKSIRDKVRRKWRRFRH
jgi:hypothetical protein